MTCKKAFHARIDDSIPKIIGKNLTDRELKMIEEFKDGNK